MRKKTVRRDSKATKSNWPSVDNIDLPQEFLLSWTFALCSTRAKTKSSANIMAVIEHQFI